MIVTMSEKGQVTIPQEFRKSLHIAKGDSLLIEMDSRGAIPSMSVRAVLPVEVYSEAPLNAFADEDAMTLAERRRVQKALYV